MTRNLGLQPRLGASIRVGSKGTSKA